MTPIQIIALIDAFVVLAEKLPTLVEALKRNTEMTPEEETALDARIAGLKVLPHWKRE